MCWPNYLNWDPNYPHLCRLPAEALAAGWSLHLQLVAWEGETIGLNVCSQPHAHTGTLKGKRVTLERLGGWPQTSKTQRLEGQRAWRWSSGIMLLDGLGNIVGTRPNKLAPLNSIFVLSGKFHLMLCKLQVRHNKGTEGQRQVASMCQARLQADTELRII